MTQQMEDSIIDSSLGLEPKQFTLKVLFGPMFGCELSLPGDDYFIITQPSLAYAIPDLDVRQEFTSTASFSRNTLYIPCDEPSPNFILHLTDDIDNGQRGCYQIDIHGANGSDSIPVQENTIFRHDNICLAFKESHNAWGEEVASYNRTLSKPSHHATLEHISTFSTRKRRTLFFAGLLLISLIGGAGTAWYKHHLNENKVVTLHVSLAGAPAPLKIIRASNNNLYVFADNHQEMVWLREVIYKLSDNQKPIPIWTAQTKKEIIKIVQRKGYPALQLDLSTPEHPQISTYEALNKQQQEALKSILLQAMPYAKNIDIRYKNKETLLKQAQQGLERLHIPYRQISTDSGYALIIKDALSDNTLTTLRGFITDFYNQWGNSIINFSINLNENWLQDKSYLDTKGGYLFLNPLHWYFPLQDIQQQFPQQKGDA